MRVLTRQDGTSGHAVISVPWRSIDRVNSALDAIAKAHRDVPMSKLIVRLIEDEARRLGWVEQSEDDHATAAAAV